MAAASVTTRASFEKYYPENYAREAGGTLEEIGIPVTTMDALGLKPAIVKIDVEGHEFEVIKGMTRIIERYRPIIFLEAVMFLECRDFLARYGYSTHRYDRETDTLQPTDTNDGVPNIYFATSESLSRFKTSVPDLP